MSSIKVAAQTTKNDIWDDFLKLQISANTKRIYASALDDFFTQLTGSSANPQELVATNVGDLREGKLWIIGKGKTQQQSIDLAPRTVAALEEWLTVREGQANEPTFIALDGRSYGKRLQGKASGVLADLV